MLNHHIKVIGGIHLSIKEEIKISFVRKSALGIKIPKILTSYLSKENTVIGIWIICRGETGTAEELATALVDLFTGLYLSNLHCYRVISVFGKVDKLKVENHIIALDLALCVRFSVNKVVILVVKICNLTGAGIFDPLHIESVVAAEPYVCVKGSHVGQLSCATLDIWHNCRCLSYDITVLFYSFTCYS